jgi:hypothetical protein
MDGVLQSIVQGAQNMIVKEEFETKEGVKALRMGLFTNKCNY